jgi:diacylglycerol kinase family enzyme
MSAQKNIAIVCNPLAGVGKAVKLAQKIAAEFLQKEIDYVLFIRNWPRNFEGFTDVFIVGGDGTLNYFFNHYPHIKLPLVIFKGGTGNDVHSLLYGNKTFEEQLHTALTAEPKPVDGAKCNGKYFINGVGIGFEAAIAKSLIGKNKKPGKTSFMGAILRKIFFYSSKKYKINSDEYNEESNNLLISVMNGHRAGGGFYVAPGAAIDDGFLDVVIVRKLHPFRRLRWLPVIEKGNHLHLSFIKWYKTNKVVISGNELIQAHLDGEYFEARRLEIELLEKKYNFRF